MLGTRRKLWVGSVIACATAILFATQNCTKPASANKNEKSSAAPASLQGGDGYDGKLFINRLIGSVCPDGSDIKNSVEVVSYTSAFVTRENCANIPKRAINAADFSYMPHNLNNLIFTARAFDLDPIVSLDPYSTTYLCRGDETALYYKIFHNITLPPEWKDRYGDLVFKADADGVSIAKFTLGFYEQGTRDQLVGPIYQSGEFPATLTTSGVPWVLAGTDAKGVRYSLGISPRPDGTLVGKGVYVRDANLPPRGPADIPDFNLNFICYPQ